MNGTMKAGRVTKLRTRYAFVNTRHKTARIGAHRRQCTNSVRALSEHRDALVYAECIAGMTFFKHGVFTCPT